VLQILQRTLNTSDAEMGEMMRMVIAHEVGHALGFPHNMGASCAYDTENYRNGEFTQKNGIAASLMDYAVSTILLNGDKTFVLSAKWDLTIIMLQLGI
jgi:hypothetical protein